MSNRQPGGDQGPAPPGGSNSANLALPSAPRRPMLLSPQGTRPEAGSLTTLRRTNPGLQNTNQGSVISSSPERSDSVISPGNPPEPRQSQSGLNSPETTSLPPVKGVPGAPRGESPLSPLFSTTDVHNHLQHSSASGISAYLHQRAPFATRPMPSTSPTNTPILHNGNKASASFPLTSPSGTSNTTPTSASSSSSTSLPPSSLSISSSTSSSSSASSAASAALAASLVAPNPSSLHIRSNSPSRPYSLSHPHALHPDSDALPPQLFQTTPPPFATTPIVRVLRPVSSSSNSTHALSTSTPLNINTNNARGSSSNGSTNTNNNTNNNGNRTNSAGVSVTPSNTTVRPWAPLALNNASITINTNLNNTTTASSFASTSNGSSSSSSTSSTSHANHPTSSLTSSQSFGPTSPTSKPGLKHMIALPLSPVGKKTFDWGSNPSANHSFASTTSSSTSASSSRSNSSSTSNSSSSGSGGRGGNSNANPSSGGGNSTSFDGPILASSGIPSLRKGLTIQTNPDTPRDDRSGETLAIGQIPGTAHPLSTTNNPFVSSFFSTPSAQSLPIGFNRVNTYPNTGPLPFLPPTPQSAAVTPSGHGMKNPFTFGSRDEASARAFTPSSLMRSSSYQRPQTTGDKEREKERDKEKEREKGKGEAGVGHSNSSGNDNAVGETAGFGSDGDRIVGGGGSSSNSGGNEKPNFKKSRGTSFTFDSLPEDKRLGDNNAPTTTPKSLTKTVSRSQSGASALGLANMAEDAGMDRMYLGEEGSRTPSGRLHRLPRAKSGAGLDARSSRINDGSISSTGMNGNLGQNGNGNMNVGSGEGRGEGMNNTLMGKQGELVDSGSVLSNLAIMNRTRYKSIAFGPGMGLGVGGPMGLGGSFATRGSVFSRPSVSAIPNMIMGPGGMQRRMTTVGSGMGLGDDIGWEGEGGAGGGGGSNETVEMVRPGSTDDGFGGQGGGRWSGGIKDGRPTEDLSALSLEELSELHRIRALNAKCCLFTRHIDWLEWRHTIASWLDGPFWLAISVSLILYSLVAQNLFDGFATQNGDQVYRWMHVLITFLFFAELVLNTLCWGVRRYFGITYIFDIIVFLSLLVEVPWIGIYLVGGTIRDIEPPTSIDDYFHVGVLRLYHDVVQSVKFLRILRLMRAAKSLLNVITKSTDVDAGKPGDKGNGEEKLVSRKPKKNWSWWGSSDDQTNNGKSANKRKDKGKREIGSNKADNNEEMTEGAGRSGGGRWRRGNKIAPEPMPGEGVDEKGAKGNNTTNKDHSKKEKKGSEDRKEGVLVSVIPNETSRPVGHGGMGRSQVTIIDRSGIIQTSEVPTSPDDTTRGRILVTSNAQAISMTSTSANMPTTSSSLAPLTAPLAAPSAMRTRDRQRSPLLSDSPSTSRSRRIGGTIPSSQHTDRRRENTVVATPSLKHDNSGKHTRNNDLQNGDVQDEHFKADDSSSTLFPQNEDGDTVGALRQSDATSGQREQSCVSDLAIVTTSISANHRHRTWGSRGNGSPNQSLMVTEGKNNDSSSSSSSSMSNGHQNDSNVASGEESADDRGREGIEGVEGDGEIDGAADRTRGSSNADSLRHSGGGGGGGGGGGENELSRSMGRHSHHSQRSQGSHSGSLSHEHHHHTLLSHHPLHHPNLHHYSQSITQSKRLQELREEEDLLEVVSMTRNNNSAELARLVTASAMRKQKAKEWLRKMVSVIKANDEAKTNLLNMNNINNISQWDLARKASIAPGLLLGHGGFGVGVSGNMNNHLTPEMSAVLMHSMSKTTLYNMQRQQIEKNAEKARYNASKMQYGPSSSSSILIGAPKNTNTTMNGTGINGFGGGREGGGYNDEISRSSSHSSRSDSLNINVVGGSNDPGLTHQPSGHVSSHTSSSNGSNPLSGPFGSRLSPSASGGYGNRGTLGFTLPVQGHSGSSFDEFYSPYTNYTNYTNYNPYTTQQPSGGRMEGGRISTPDYSTEHSALQRGGRSSTTTTASTTTTSHTTGAERTSQSGISNGAGPQGSQGQSQRGSDSQVSNYTQATHSPAVVSPDGIHGGGSSTGDSGGSSGPSGGTRMYGLNSRATTGGEGMSYNIPNRQVLNARTPNQPVRLRAAMSSHQLSVPTGANSGNSGGESSGGNGGHSPFFNTSPNDASDDDDTSGSSPATFHNRLAPSPQPFRSTLNNPQYNYNNVNVSLLKLRESSSVPGNNIPGQSPRTTMNMGRSLNATPGGPNGVNNSNSRGTLASTPGTSSGQNTPAMAAMKGQLDYLDYDQDKSRINGTLTSQLSLGASAHGSHTPLVRNTRGQSFALGVPTPMLQHRRSQFLSPAGNAALIRRTSNFVGANRSMGVPGSGLMNSGDDSDDMGVDHLTVHTRAMIRKASMAPSALDPSKGLGMDGLPHPQLPRRESTMVPVPLTTRKGSLTESFSLRDPESSKRRTLISNIRALPPADSVEEAGIKQRIKALEQGRTQFEKNATRLGGHLSERLTRTSALVMIVLASLLPFLLVSNLLSPFFMTSSICISRLTSIDAYILSTPFSFYFSTPYHQYTLGESR